MWPKIEFGYIVCRSARVCPRWAEDIVCTMTMPANLSNPKKLAKLEITKVHTWKPDEMLVLSIGFTWNNGETEKFDY